MGPNKATSLVWGQWDLNIAGKGVQLFHYMRYNPEKLMVKCQLTTYNA
jgi:hypothetical protein